jgi:1-deoxy-D-xylulose-5-phosphate reductoisomerase
VDKLLALLDRIEARGRIDEVEAVCVGSEASAEIVSSKYPRIKIYVGDSGLTQAARELDYDIMLNALVGIVGLAPTLSAIENGAGRKGFEIALANKETLVAGGRLVTREAKKAGVTIVPVDSEHSAIFQCLAGNEGNAVRRVIVTASGGPFLGMSQEDLGCVTVEQALSHPNWAMGNKITIDSSTMLNKAFELIEAKWLFGLTCDKIEAIIHPSSIVHSLVEFEDGALMAQLGVPSMTLPVSYALSYPHRWSTNAGYVDLAALGSLEFAEPSGEGKVAIEMARVVMRADEDDGVDSLSIAMNGANEVFVEAFLEGRIAFTDIFAGVLDVLTNSTEYVSTSGLDDIMRIDREAREAAAVEVEERQRCL